MDHALCPQCGASVPASEMRYTLVGSYCATCHVAETADAARLERRFMRSLGWRHLAVGLVMLAIGMGVLAIGLGVDGTMMLIPTGMLLGGLVELVRGLTKLSSNP